MANGVSVFVVSFVCDYNGQRLFNYRVVKTFISVSAENYKVTACTLNASCFDCPRVTAEPLLFGQIVEYECHALRKATSVSVESPAGTYLVGCEMQVRVASVCP